MAEAVEYSLQEIGLHNSANDTWMVIHGEGEITEKESFVIARNTGS